MLKATVSGSVWATRRIDSIPRGAFLEVLTDDGARLVAFDVLGSGLGERVLVTTGSVASGWFGSAHPPIDALIIGSLDPEHEAGGKSTSGAGARSASAQKQQSAAARRRTPAPASRKSTKERKT
jgi:ethanolamine utilization protein EutN